MAVGAVLGVVKAVAKPVAKAVGVTGKGIVKEGASAGVKEGGKELGKIFTKQGFENIIKDAGKNIVGKAGVKLFGNIKGLGVDKVAGSLAKLMTGNLDDAAKAVLKGVFDGIPLGREAFKHLGDLLFPIGGKKAGAMLSNKLAGLFGDGGNSAFGKMDSGNGL